MANWKELIDNIHWQLERSPLRENFHSEEMAARKAIADAATSGDEVELRARRQPDRLRLRSPRHQQAQDSRMAAAGFGPVGLEQSPQ